MTAIQNAVARQQNTPGAMVQQYRSDFAAVLPSHIKPETWVRVAQGALKKGRKQGQQFELEIAAQNNPGVFLASLLEAARLGLEPGTEQFYLTPRKVKGQLEILGIVGYQGHIELMYRAGAVSSVVAEVVRERDTFRYQPGQDAVPHHVIDWDSDDRGRLRLVYAYARMKDGATSRVIVLNRAQIETIKASSQGANSDYSPWQKHEEAMWLKSSVRQLQKWVPTSAEYIREQMRAARDVASEPIGSTSLPTAEPEPAHNPDTGEVVDGEVIDEPAPWDEQAD
ncbi:recombinase RecT [Ornithinimicrobium sp. LYQ92]|uniref:recombinase RecT n=1 Tax=Serinicoccus sp. LYQ92 TaxID=3378798 RepID=UPI003851B9A9